MAKECDRLQTTDQLQIAEIVIIKRFFKKLKITKKSLSYHFWKNRDNLLDYSFFKFKTFFYRFLQIDYYIIERKL